MINLNRIKKKNKKISGLLNLEKILIKVTASKSSNIYKKLLKWLKILDSCPMANKDLTSFKNILCHFFIINENLISDAMYSSPPSKASIKDIGMNKDTLEPVQSNLQ
jgi:hypothetical protein